MVDLVSLKQRNAERWSKAKLTRGPEFDKPANKAVANKSTYLTIARKAGMPDIAWVFIAVSHYRESSQDFSKNLGQGDPLDRVTVNVPKGRGPFVGPDAFINGAVDALKNCPPYAARELDWSLAGMLTLLERYNGIGYAAGPFDKRTGTHYPSQPSPYIWSGTDQYVRGKYIADGEFSPSVVDKQLGCAGLIMRMMQFDPTITFTGATIIGPKPPPPLPKAPTPQPPQPSPWAAFFMAIASFFNKGKK